jgi:hypothetical protein
VEGLQSSSGHSSISCLPGPRIRPPGSCRGPFFRPAPPRFRKHPPVIRRRELATTQDPRGSGVCGEKVKKREKKTKKKPRKITEGTPRTKLQISNPGNCFWTEMLDSFRRFFFENWMECAQGLVYARTVYTVIANNLKMPQSRSSELVHSRPNQRLPRFFRGTSRTSRPT